MEMAMNVFLLLGVCMISSSASDFLSSAYSIFAYVGTGLGGSRMMEKVNGTKPWLFWVPVANAYAMGALADRQAELCEGETTSYRKKLLAWNIVMISMAVILVLAVIPVLIVLSSLGLLDENGEFHTREAVDDALVGPMMFFTLAFLLFLAFAIVYIVFHYIVLNRIYKLFAPDIATGLTVLSIFVGIATPIIFLVLSGRDPVLPYDADSYQIPTQDPNAPNDGGEDTYTL
jgi:hypothetical protein